MSFAEICECIPWDMYHVSKKTAPFYFCNNFVRPCITLIIFGTPQ